jgi:aspartate aminotransferase
MLEQWLSDRAQRFESSGIRRMFDLSKSMKDPVNLSIGQPDFDVPEEVKQACIAAIEQGRNGYTMTQGISELREKLQQRINSDYPGQDRRLMITSGTTGALVLAFMSVVNPGDEVILMDPYFVMYPPLVELVGGVAKIIDADRNFQVDVSRVEQAITSRTKLIVLNSPSNPTGVVIRPEVVKAIAELAHRKNVLLISDEIYRHFCFDGNFDSPAAHNRNVLVIDGFSKSHGMTGWRIGFCHGPVELIETMNKLQQFTFVCAPHPVQWGAIAALDCDMTRFVTSYRHKRDRIVAGLKDQFELVLPDGAFYAFPKTPWGSSHEFVQACVEENLLVIPGKIFSRHDTHFRISYAAEDRVIDRGLEILNKVALRGR